MRSPITVSADKQVFRTGVLHACDIAVRRVAKILQQSILIGRRGLYDLDIGKAVHGAAGTECPHVLRTRAPSSERNAVGPTSDAASRLKYPMFAPMSSTPHPGPQILPENLRSLAARTHVCTMIVVPMEASSAEAYILKVGKSTSCHCPSCRSNKCRFGEFLRVQIRGDNRSQFCRRSSRRGRPIPARPAFCPSSSRKQYTTSASVAFLGKLISQGLR